MNNRTVELILKARDEATATWNRFATKITRDLGTIESKFTRLGSLAKGVFSAYIFTNLLHAGVEAERQVGRLTAALQIAGVYTEPLAKQMEAYAEALSLTTHYSHEAILNTMTLLVSFTGLAGDAVQPLTKSVIDFARMTGLSTDRVAMLVAKTMAGSNAMKRWGIAIDETKTGTERLKDITEKLQQVSGDFAEKEAKSLAGSFDGMIVSFNRLKEVSGTELLKAFAPLMTALTTVIPYIGKVFQSIMLGINIAATGTVAALVQIGAIAESVWNRLSGSKSTTVADRWVNLTLGLGDLMKGFGEIWKSGEGSTSGISAVGKKIKEDVDRIVETFKKVGVRGLEFISDEQKKRFEDAAKTAEHIANWMKQSAATREGLMKENLQALRGQALEQIKVPEMVDTQELIKFNAFEKKLIEIQDLGKNVSESLIDNFSNGIDNMVYGMIAGTETMAEAFKKMALSIISDIISMTVKMFIFRAISGLFGAGVIGGTTVASAGGVGPPEMGSVVPNLAGAGGGAPIAITMNVNALDAKSFHDRLQQADFMRAIMSSMRSASRKEVSL